MSTELSTKANLVAELQEKLAKAQSNATEFEAKIESSTIKINELQEQLLGLKAEKVSADTQVGELRSRNEALTADLAELERGARTRCRPRG